MGKRLDQLKFDPEAPPLTSSVELAQASSAAEVTLEEIEEMLDDAKYRFAWDTLQDLKLHGQTVGLFSAAQRQAIRNIRIGAQRAEDGRGERREGKRGGSRRHEGWTPSY